jgi:folylpolyglutamate synthase/dihydropteroate synthase
MMQALNPLVSHWLSCPLPGAEGVTREAVERVARRGGKPFTWAQSASAAMDRACELAGRDGLVLVTGSHYLVGAVIPATLVNGTSCHRSVSGAVSRNDLLTAASITPATF